MTLPELTPLQAPAAPPVVLEPGGDRIAHARQLLHSVPYPEVPAVSLYDLGIVRDAVTPRLQHHSRHGWSLQGREFRQCHHTPPG